MSFIKGIFSIFSLSSYLLVLRLAIGIQGWTGRLKRKRSEVSTDNDRYSGHGYSGIHRYSGTKTPDDAILFTVSGITAIVEQKFRKFRGFYKNFDADLSQVGILKLIKL